MPDRTGLGRRPWLAVAVGVISAVVLGIGIAGAKGAPNAAKAQSVTTQGPLSGIVVGDPQSDEQPTGLSEASSIDLEVVRASGDVGGAAHCTEVEVSYQLDAGNLAADGKMGIGQVTGSAWTGCSGTLGLPVRVTQVGASPVVAETGLDGAQGRVRIESLTAKVQGYSCTFSVTGSVTAELRLIEKTITPVADGATLLVSDAVGCSGLANNGDGVVIDGSFQLD